MLRLAPILASMLSVDLGAALRRARRSALFWALAGLFAFAAYAAALVAAGLALAAHYPPATAALMVCLSQVGLAALALLGLAISNAVERRRQRKNDSQRTLATTAMIAAALPMLQSRKGMAVAAVAGLAVLMALRRGGDEQE
ncbi:hypothetical protein [Stappia indica]|uniref:Uncharacterized protein n=1 Tax=Stappia indica TaxID=538381 RepID=A0A285SF83_9HYPH|nr:hypothetical protein [Stappia indica]MCC4245106.1 hypothetical protein [Stappia indica]SOC06592.1 hypothetical protein SAMN05421512_105132 [Stappia indica]